MGTRRSCLDPAKLTGRLAVEQRSRQVLAVWAACCLADAASRRIHVQLDFFQMALDYRDLRHLALADGVALQALQIVCGYLRDRTADSAFAAPVFSLRPTDATMRFAAQARRNLSRSACSLAIRVRAALIAACI